MVDPKYPIASSTEGLDLRNVSSWLAEHLETPVGPLYGRLITGGRSNLTYLVEDESGRRWVLRRPPLGHILPTAHDVVREHRVISALRATDVPLPGLVGSCTDPDVTGAPFFVMEFVDGLVLRTTTDVLDLLDPGAQHRVGLALAECAAKIHSVDPSQVGLGELGKRDDYLRRQLDRWIRQYRRTQTHEFPQIEKAYSMLLERIPVQCATGIVHGDFRLDNVIVDKSGEVLAVLDWELCTLGDQFADIGQMILRTVGDSHSSGGRDPRPLAAAPGYASAAEILHAYELAAGLELPDIDYYVAFAAWKSACILQGVYVRQRAGAMGQERHDEVQLLDLIRARTEDALSRLGSS